MYFLKITPDERQVGLIGITRSNVFCLCPKCGKPVQVDLQRFAGDEGFTLSASAVLCDDCTQAHLRATVLKAVITTRSH